MRHEEEPLGHGEVRLAEEKEEWREVAAVSMESAEEDKSREKMLSAEEEKVESTSEGLR